jgi:DNA-binding FadR family transcriptional regulator
MRDSIARGDSILDADMDFHLAISKAAQNEVLRNAVQLLRNLMRQGIYYKLLKRGSAHSERVYRNLQGNSEAPVPRARSAMRRHMAQRMKLVPRAIQGFSMEQKV